VITFLKLSPSSLCSLTSSWYNLIGVEPVAKPSTQFSFFAAFAFISVAISYATNADPSFGEGKIWTGTFSNASIMSFRYCYKN